MGALSMVITAVQAINPGAGVRKCQEMSQKLKPKQEEAIIALLLVLAPAPAEFRQRRHKVARYHLRNARCPILLVERPDTKTFDLVACLINLPTFRCVPLPLYNIHLGDVALKRRSGM